MSKVLFCSAPGRVGVLVTTTAGRRREKRLRFRDAHAALDWCNANATTLIYVPPTPSNN